MVGIRGQCRQIDCAYHYMLSTFINPYSGNPHDPQKSGKALAQQWIDNGPNMYVQGDDFKHICTVKGTLVFFYLWCCSHHCVVCSVSHVPRFCSVCSVLSVFEPHGGEGLDPVLGLHTDWFVETAQRYCLAGR